MLFAAAAVVLRLLGFPMAPMLLGIILGGKVEENLRRALIISNDSWSFLWKRPLTLCTLVIAAMILFVPMLSPWLRRIFGRRKEAAGEGG